MLAGRELPKPGREECAEIASRIPPPPLTLSAWPDTVPGVLLTSPVLGDAIAVLRFSTVCPGRMLISANAVSGRRHLHETARRGGTL
jgi:hypothetical protein